MKTHRSWREIRGCRPFAVAIMAVAMVAACLHPASAQDDESGVDDNTYTGPNYGWSVEWDEDVWEVAEEDNSDGADFLVLQTLDGESPVAYTRFYAVDDLFDDPDECAASWEDRIAEGEGNSGVEVTEEYDVPPPPRGGASATYTYTFETEDGDTFDNVEHFQCQYLEEDGPLLIIWIFAEEADFEDAIPLFEDLIDTVVIPEGGSPDEGSDEGADEGSDEGSDEGTDEGEDGGDDEGQDEGSADSGIDGNTYTSPTYGYTVEWDEDVWTANPDAELVDDGRVGLDRLYIEHTEDGDLFSGFYIEAKVDYDGNVSDCVEGEEDLLATDDALQEFDPLEDEQGDPIAGESDAGGEYVALLGSYEDENGDEYELVWYVECQTLEEGESVAIFSLFTSEANYEDELELAQEVIDSLDYEGEASPNDDADDEPADDEEAPAEDEDEPTPDEDEDETA
jgi:hypothetical protein